MSEFQIIYNPFANRGLTRHLLDDFLQILESRNMGYKLHETAAPGHATQIVQKIVESSCDTEIPRIVIAGGDGTIFECLNGFPDFAEAIFCILPIGTGNDAANALNIAKGISDCAESLFQGHTQKFDYIVINQQKDEAIKSNLFVSYGIAAEMVIAMQDFKTKNKLSYMKSLLMRILSYKSKVYQVYCGDDINEYLADFCAVHNSPIAGGGMRLVDNACMGDGMLDLLIVEYKGKMRRLLNLFSIFRKRLHLQPNVTVRRVASVRINSPNDDLCCIDGEIRRLNSTDVRIVQGGLNLIVPK